MSNLPKNINSKDLDYFTWMDKLYPEPICINEINQGIFVNSSFIEVNKFFLFKSKISILNLKTITTGLIKRKFSIFKDVSVAICVNQWSNNYFHWFTEVIPRIIESKKCNSDVVFVFPFTLNEQYQIPSLGMLNISYVHNNYHWIFFKKAFSSQNTIKNTGHFLLSYFEDFNKYFVSHRSEKNKKIYIKRKANKRRIINENEIIPIFEASGFIIVELENLTFQKQLELFSEANVIASIHGAGLTNMLFLSKPGIVLELSKENENMDKCFFNLSKVCCHDYYYLFCKSDKPEESYHSANIFVHAGKLMSILNEIKKNEKY